ncbi:response regulator [Iodidimonas gelatinilytica]|uniref:Response regulator n=1 Tax=Iodidimonas gelatinilytica TaxID=1236966 RepID=A0A5A7MQY5_9PROT|nr:response regulator [Iodidimonas gelatinilytica]GEQ97269.1 response regulator [Iodidimonas gelatinilytica]
MAKILLAEDEASVREFVRRGLESHGYDVVDVADGGAALEKLQAGPFDLLLADIVMPVMDGIALALKLSADRPHMPVLLMTGYAMEKQRAHNLDFLITDVLSKPFTLEQLLKAVRHALANPPKNTAP